MEFRRVLFRSIKGATQEELEEVCTTLKWKADDSPAFKLKGELGDAPLLEWQYRDSPPKFSAWRRQVVTDYVVEHYKDLEGFEIGRAR